MPPSDTIASRPADPQAWAQALAYALLGVLKSEQEPCIGPDGNRRLVERFFDLLGRRAPRIFCDVGANDGTTALIAKRLFPDCAVYSFEANPDIQARHARKLQAAGVESFNFAIAAADGPLDLFEPRTLSRAYVDGEIVPAEISEPADTGKSSILKRDERATYRQHRVDGVTLDRFFEARGAGDGAREVALWVDVEGAAYDVLVGARETLGRVGLLFVETENFTFWRDQKTCGAVTCLLVEQGFLPIGRDWEYGSSQFNMLFIHCSMIDLLADHLFGPGAKPLAPFAPRAPVGGEQPRKKRHTSLGASIIADIPIYIPTFNNPTYTKRMIEQLSAWKLGNVYILDNASTSEDMRELLDKLQDSVKIIHLPQNHGPHHIIQDDASYGLLPEIFCITDPDIAFNDAMPQDFLYTLLNQTHKHSIGKAGLALDITDRETLQNKHLVFDGVRRTVWDWEQQFWSNPLPPTPDGNPVYKAHLDTTFALYNKKFFDRQRFYEAVRVGGVYTSRHLPWSRSSGIPAGESDLYRRTQKHSYHLL